MKIAQVSPYDFAYPGGANNHILYLDRELRRLGHQTVIVAPSSRPEVAEAYPGLRIIGKPHAIHSGGSVARVTLSLRLAKQVKQLLEQEHFDIIHLHEPLTPTLPWTFLRYSQSVNVGTFHAHQDRRRLPSQLYFYGRHILRRWFNRLHGRIAVSPPAAQYVQRYFKSTYRIIPNGVDCARFCTPTEPLPQYADGKVNLLFVGRWEPRKGLKYLVRAFALLKHQFPQVRLLVVGPDGGHRVAMARTLAGMGLAEDVVLVGYVSDEELPRYYGAADIYCYPATGLESFGIVLLEAMASGTPIVASRTPGSIYLLEEGVQGLLVPPKKPEALAQALARLVAQPELRQRLGQEGQRHAQEYSWERTAQQIVAYYEELLEQYGPPGSPRSA